MYIFGHFGCLSEQSVIWTALPRATKTAGGQFSPRRGCVPALSLCSKPSFCQLQALSLPTCFYVHIVPVVLVVDMLLNGKYSLNGTLLQCFSSTQIYYIFFTWPLQVLFTSFSSDGLAPVCGLYNKITLSCPGWVTQLSPRPVVRLSLPCRQWTWGHFFLWWHCLPFLARSGGEKILHKVNWHSSPGGNILLDLTQFKRQSSGLKYQRTPGRANPWQGDRPHCWTVPWWWQYSHPRW